MMFYKFGINFSDQQRSQLLEISKKLHFNSLYNEGNFFSTDIDQVNDVMPKWVYDLFHFPYRRIIFLYNKGIVTPHKDNGRSSVITFPLNYTDAKIVWTNTNKKLHYGKDSYLINVSETHHVELETPTDRYFLQLPLDGTWEQNVSYFKDKLLI